MPICRSEKCSSLIRALRRLGGQPLVEGGLQPFDRHPDLLHTVAVANRDRFVLKAVEVDGDAERRADLVLPAIPLAYALRLVVLDEVVLRQVAGDFSGQCSERLFLTEW